MRRAALVLVVALAVACVGGRSAHGEPAPKSPADLPLPRTPTATATALKRAERALRSPATRPADLPRLGWEQQNAYRALTAHPDWLPTVLAKLPADVKPIVTDNDRAGRDLAAVGGEGPRPRQLPDWTIVSPLPVEVLRSYYGEAEAATGIPWAYFASIHLVETRLGRIRGTSTAGAQGPMQFIPETWARYGQGDINDNHDAILAAGRLLQASGAPADIGQALLRYNNSRRYVDAVQAYAQLMLSDERAFLGYYQWQVYSATTKGTFVLPEGYPNRAARRVTSSRG
ncbi:MAG TPA: lytic transglycosylase domain-containing protein [Acidimicrobiia bacterium]|nr:lytic transglycosylase domain-containing protein [Acidimicrobiia bacterium]